MSLVTRSPALLARRAGLFLALFEQAAINGAECRPPAPQSTLRHGQLSVQ
jgi:hypothetical protein